MIAWKPSWRKALIFGLAAFVGNEVSLLFSPEGVLQLGNVILFLSAISLGFSAAMLSVCCALIPQFILHADTYMVMRALTIVVAIAYCAHRIPRLPAFVVCLMTWVCVVLPFTQLNIAFGSPAYPHSGSSLAMQLIIDTSLALFAGSLLLHPAIWGSLAPVPRRASVRQTAVHLGTMISLLLFLSGMMIAGSAFQVDIFTLLESADPYSLYPCIALTFVLVPSLFWWGIPVMRNWMNSARVLEQKPQRVAGSGKGWSDESSQSNSELFNRTSQALERSKEGVEEEDEDPEGILVLSTKNDITYVNSVFAEMAKFESEKSLGEPLAGVRMDDRFREELLEVVHLTTDKGAINRELKVRDQDGNYRYFEVHSVLPRAGADGSQKGAIVTSKEITKKRTVETHLLEAQRVKSLGAVVSGMAHAFNNSLTAIIGNASIAKHSDDPKLHRDALNQILECATNTGKLVWKLLDFAEGRPELLRTVDLKEQLAERADFLKSAVGEQYELKYSNCAHPVWVDCDLNLLLQAITHLILNSKEAYQSGEAGKISVELDTEEIDEALARFLPGSRPGKFARLRVRDEGSGMTNDILARAFDPMFTTKSTDGQSGLGLSIVFAIVRAHDGFLSVESEPEKGTSTSIYLPLTEDETMLLAQEPVTESQQVRRGNNEKILVVEDEPNVRELVVKMLSTLGYEVRYCENGEEALEECQQREFDLVLVDVMMPRMGGMEFVNRVRELDKPVRTVVMTGQITQDPACNDTYVLAKPFDINKLSEKIEEVLRSPDQDCFPQRPSESLSSPS